MKEQLPIIEEVESLSPAELYSSFAEDSCSFFLDSSRQFKEYGNYSFLGTDPFLILKTQGERAEIITEDRRIIKEEHPLKVLRELLKSYKMEIEHPLPLLSGAVGYFSYDLGRELEDLPEETEDDLGLPQLYLGFYDLIFIYDHQEKRLFLSSSGLSPAGSSQRRAKKRLAEMKERVDRERPEGLQKAGKPVYIDPHQISSNFTRQEYLQAVERAREYIAAGDIFQVNISQRFQAPLLQPPYDLYRRLRKLNPAPFSSYLNFPEVKVASSSPERFIQLRGRRLETRPIKGTRPRGNNPAEDESMKKELQESIKDRAENLMIVDLERNDFGRISEYGSVKVEELFGLEDFATVFHLVSTVTGRLGHDRDATDVIKATFPGGSITGAPKIRAMEIIEELEPVRRHVYTGSIGYLDFRGDMDLNIVIRTFILKKNKAYFQVGGGIVTDSSPEMEYQETLDKGRALMKTLTGQKKEEELKRELMKG